MELWHVLPGLLQAGRRWYRRRPVFRRQASFAPMQVAVERLENRQLLSGTVGGAATEEWLTAGDLGLTGQGIPLSDGNWFLGTGVNPDDLVLRASTNLNAADTSNSDQLVAGGGLGLNLSGNGLTVGVWDGGKVLGTHQEFGGRVAYGDSASNFSNHATHVAGTIGATGVNQFALGLANQVDIISYDWSNDVNELQQASDVISVSNHSYSFITGWVNGFNTTTLGVSGVHDVWFADRSLYDLEDPGFGKYGFQTRSLDQVLSDNPDVLSVWAASNDRNDNSSASTYVSFFSQDLGIQDWQGSGWYLVDNATVPRPPKDGDGGTGYDSLPGMQVAKNTLTVGAISDITVDPFDGSAAALASFSSFGPTDDGRVKPDVVTNGISLYSPIASSTSNYANFSGTSMASPTAAGAATLLVEHYQNLNGSLPNSATTKGAIVHTAVDAGTLGPDYAYGWGVLDAAAAATFLTAANQGAGQDQLFETTYTGTELTYEVVFDGNGPLKTTIVWTDLPGATQASILDDRTARLVNDLDIWVTGADGTTYLPWTLDPANPSAGAVRTAANHVDNVEQVLINPAEIGVYTIHVGHSGAAFTQDVSWFVSGGVANDPTKGIVSGTVWDDVNENGVFDVSENALADATVFLDMNGNGRLDTAEPSRITNADGKYLFYGLEPGTYSVLQVLEGRTQQTFPVAAVSDTLQLLAHWNHDEHDENATADSSGIGTTHEEEPTTVQSFADVWIDGHVAYLGHSDINSGVDIIDVSDPSHPVLLAEWVAPDAGLRFQDVKVRDGIAYFPSDSGGGMYIVDVSDPANPQTLVHVGPLPDSDPTTPEVTAGLSQIHNVFLDGNYLYQADSRTAHVHVFDVSDLASPVFVRMISSPSGAAVHDVTVQNGRLYTAVIGGAGTTDIFDISDVANAAPLLGSFVSGSATHSNWPSQDDQYLFVARETSGGDVRVFDISDPANVVQVSSLNAADLGIAAFSPHNPVVDGDLLYVSWYQAGVQVFDVSDPANPVHLGGYDTYPGSSGSFRGNWGVATEDAGRFIIASDIEYGMFILSTPTGRGHVVDVAAGDYVTGLDFGTRVSSALVIDDGDAGFATVGNWVNYQSAGFEGDLRYSNGGSGADTATWTFDVTPGQYRVSATWSPQSNLATNAPFTILDGASSLGTVLINQELAPDDFSDVGAIWEDLGGLYTVTGTTLTVRLTDAVNEYVFADAIRVERVGEGPSGPEIQVADGVANIADDSASVDFGSTEVGTAVTKTFTVKNVGNEDLTLQPVSVPAGFTVVSNLTADTVLIPNAEVTFTVRLDATAIGPVSGELTFVNTDGDENPFNFAISGTVTAVSTAQIIDDGDAGFATVGNWVNYQSAGFEGDLRYSKAGSGADTATWTFDVTPGQYRVSATWSPQSNLATNAPFTILDGASSLGTVLINQELAPDDFSDVGAIWEDLGGLYTVTGTTLTVRLTDAANEYVFADAIRVERVGEGPSGPEIQVADGVANIADDSGSVDFGSTEVGTAVTKTFTVKNVGNEDLTLQPVSVPAGFTVVSNLAADTVLIPNAEVTFTVRLDATAIGPVSGELTFVNTDGDENPFNFAISGTVTAVSTAQVIDNGDPGFGTQGNWIPYSGQGLQNDVHYTAKGSGEDVATWTFTVSPGQYAVSATWSPQSNRATNAPYTIFDGATSLGTVSVNQKLAPDDFSDMGAAWENLGAVYDISGTTLTIQLSDLADAYVIADGVRIERIGDLPGAASIVSTDDVGLRFVNLTADVTQPLVGVSTTDIDAVSATAFGGGARVGWSVSTENHRRILAEALPARSTQGSRNAWSGQRVERVDSDIDSDIGIDVVLEEREGDAKSMVAIDEFFGIVTDLDRHPSALLLD